MDYPSSITPSDSPFDPGEIASKTQQIVCRGIERRYTDFYCTGVYGGISTAYTVGCNLRCVFCWVHWGRDYPQKAGKFCTPEYVFQTLIQNARKRRIHKLRISGGEPTLCFDHLVSVLDMVNPTPYLFLLETNGLSLGIHPEFVEKLKSYKNTHIRVSLKAATPDGFQRRTGGRGDYYNLPFMAVERLLKSGISFHVAAMSDPRLMKPDEKAVMLEKLKRTGYRDFLEEERCNPYPAAIKRLRKAGYILW
jgi:uncharacterized Fe-S cluster-containing radical SAM superfamily protein